MKSLWDALPSERRGGYAETSAALEPEVLGAIARGDAVMVKGSLGSRMGPIVKALKRRYARAGRTGAARLKRCFIGLRISPSTISVFNVFRYLTVRTGGSMMTAAMFVFLFGPWIIDHLRLRQGKGQPIREDGPASHLADQARHADHGRADDPLRRHGRRRVLWANPSNPYVWIVLGVTLALRPRRLLRRLSEGDEAEPWRLRRQAAPRHRGAGGARRLLGADEPRPPAVRDVADVPVLQGAGRQSGLVLPRLRRLHHRRRRQCREPDRRARRACDRPGDDRGRLLRRVLLRGRQRVPHRLSATAFRAGHRRACDPVRRRDRRGPRLSLVQRAARLDLHGRHRLARARRAARLGRGCDQARDWCSRSSAGCSCSKPCR